MATLFDTLKLARRLEASGFPAQQAGDMSEAIAEVVSQLATKADLAALQHATRTDLAALRAELRADIELLRQTFQPEHARAVGFAIAPIAGPPLAVCSPISAR